MEGFIQFAGRRVLVTGASSGLGRAVAVQLGRLGAEVILSGRNREELENTREAMTGGCAHVWPLELRDGERIASSVRELAGRVGRIYGLCHCGGVVETRPLASFQAESFEAMLEVNLTAGLRLAQAVTRRDVMTEEGGAILFVASIYGWVGMPGQIGYSATKGALLAAARAMAVELARRRIRVNTLSPGFVRTPMTDKAMRLLSPEQRREFEAAYPLGAGTPEDVARAAAFLLAPENRWITGSDLVVDGGYTAR